MFFGDDVIDLEGCIVAIPRHPAILAAIASALPNFPREARHAWAAQEAVRFLGFTRRSRRALDLRMDNMVPAFA